jgi:hypothetical protein
MTTSTTIAMSRPYGSAHPQPISLLLRSIIDTAAGSSVSGLGCVKTQTCCGAVGWLSQASDVASFSRQARLSEPTDAEMQPRFLRLSRGSHLAFHATMCRAAGGLEACGNRILTIFAPYTFSRSQYQAPRFRHPPASQKYRRKAIRGRQLGDPFFDE